MASNDKITPQAITTWGPFKLFHLDITNERQKIRLIACSTADNDWSAITTFNNRVPKSRAKKMRIPVETLKLNEFKRISGIIKTLMVLKKDASEFNRK